MGEQDAGAAVDSLVGTVDVTRPDIVWPPPDLVEADSAVAPELALAAQGQWGPAGRTVLLDVPDTPRQAREAGCEVFGQAAGTSFGTVLELIGGLAPLLIPNAEGVVPLSLFAVIDGFEPGQQVRELDTIGLSVRRGAPNDGGGYDLYAVEGELAPAWMDAADVPVSDGWIEARAGAPIHMSLPLFANASSGNTSHEIPLTLSGVRLTGQVLVDGPGVALESGVLSGYITRQAALDLIVDLQTNCRSDDPILYCQPLSIVIDIVNDPPEKILEQVMAIIGGFDARFSDGHPWPCTQGESCDAIGVCLQVLMEGSAIDGLTSWEAP